jgi:hypothetical protein
MNTTVLLLVLTLAQAPRTGPIVDPLSPRQWQRVDESVERALTWLATQQRADGSFAAPDTAQPAVTALCVMAFLSRGHDPGMGPYGRAIERAIEYILDCQRHDGMFTRVARIGDVYRYQQPSQTAAYNHAIAGLALCELYGMHGAVDSDRIRNAIERALTLTRQLQDKRWVYPESEGGWGYIVVGDMTETDMSITSWQLMFLRSAKTAGFEVEAERIDRSVQFIARCYEPRTGSFAYHPLQRLRWTRGMAGAGIFAMANAGMHDSPMARRAGEFLLSRPYDQYRQNPPPSQNEWYHYSVFFATAGMYQLGGDYWRAFFPTMVETLMRHQNRDGSWQTETRQGQALGNAYTTAMIVIAMDTPNQLLPIFQR